MKEDERISLMIYDILVSIKDTVTLPTHAILERTFVYSGILTIVSGLASLLDFYTFLSWYGCLTCTLLLGILLFIERSENDALLRMYRTAAISASKALRRAKSAGASGNHRGSRKQSAEREDTPRGQYDSTADNDIE